MWKEFAADQDKNAANNPSFVKKTADIQSFDGDLASYLLGYVLMYDPAWVTQKLDELKDAPGFAHNPWMANIYYMAHSMTVLGHVDWTCHGNSATSMVYLNDVTKTRSYVVWNPLPTPLTVQFYQGSQSLGQMVARPQALTSVTSLTSVSFK